MTPKHSNPTRPRRDDRREIWARAPYNFVPLPQEMVPARPPLDQDVYHEDALTGWIECELETCSPVYVRGMLTPERFAELGKKKPDELTPEEKEELAPFFSTSGETVEGYPVPTIPGSSLRGMIRTLVEIVGYGRIRWVGTEPPFTFRAVAAQSDDPLAEPYHSVLGSQSSKVRAGYLLQKGNRWYIKPAQTTRKLGVGRGESYLKVEESLVIEGEIPGYLEFNDSDYRPQLHDVSFNAEPTGYGRNTRLKVTRIGPMGEGYKHAGILVCAGNMLETQREGEGESQDTTVESPRRRHALVLLPDPDAEVLRIHPRAVQDYLDSRTRFQKEQLSDWGGAEWGCLKPGAPVFYVPNGNTVVFFGHSPNFRIPARLPGADHASTPRDFVPPEIYSDLRPDLADAVFGWVEEEGVRLEGQRAGRVFVQDARFQGAASGVWYKPEPVTPHVLAGPKPTTFQHYLVQDRQAGHDPDRKEALAHYGTPSDETQIRGHKIYWHQGETPAIEATTKECQHESQLTRLVPLKPGVHFSFKVRFENLRPEELGVLWWALALPGGPEASYRHKLGMGKPLGMGAVAIKPTLYLTNRTVRYGHLFDDAGWEEGADPADAQAYVEGLETFLREAGILSEEETLPDMERIQQLLAMLTWHEADGRWLETTRYMEIERGPAKVNEYKERPVLPDPLRVIPGNPVQQPPSRRD